MAFTLPELPFAKDALAPLMSAETLEYHHGKHHQAYVDKVNTLVGEKRLDNLSLVDLIRQAKDRGDKPLFSNAAQIWNHSFFWQCLAPANSTRPSRDLQVMIDRDFGSAEALLDTLGAEAIAHFGSGWGWLVFDNGKLKVTSLHDADTPATNGLVPLLTLDVWEHAYYIDYRNERPKFVKSVLGQLINWNFVAENLDGRGLDRADQKAAAAADLATA